MCIKSTTLDTWHTDIYHFLREFCILAALFSSRGDRDFDHQLIHLTLWLIHVEMIWRWGRDPETVAHLLYVKRNKQIQKQRTTLIKTKKNLPPCCSSDQKVAKSPLIKLKSQLWTISVFVWSCCAAVEFHYCHNQPIFVSLSILWHRYSTKVYFSKLLVQKKKMLKRGKVSSSGQPSHSPEPV